MRLEAHANGEIVAYFEHESISFGTFSAAVAEHVATLRNGLPLAAFSGSRRKSDKEVLLLLRRLAARGLLNYPLGSPRKELVVIEPQTPDYWPETAPLNDADIIVLSRFALLRRRDHELVLESPRACAVFKICDPQIAVGLALLSRPQPVKELRRKGSFLDPDLLGLLLANDILFKVAPHQSGDLRRAEGDPDLVLWDFHDLLFHTRSTQGRHTDPIGGTYPHIGRIPPQPEERPPWPGTKIDLAADTPQSASLPAFAKLLRARHSARSFDHQRPISRIELARFLDHAARILTKTDPQGAINDGGQTARPYPSAGASYELELYLAVVQCDGLARGFYHYDASAHQLAQIDVAAQDFDALLAGAQYAMGVQEAPQILITITARFGRVAWKYSALAYALILKDVGVLTQTFYLTVTDMGLGGCAIGLTDIELFRRMTGLDIHVEGPVGQFAIGRAAPPPIGPSAHG